MAKSSTFGLEAPRGEDWREQALCRGNPDLWFTSSGRALAMHICRAHCPVAEPCSRDAMAHPPKEGVQAGVAFNQERRPVPLTYYQPSRTCPSCPPLPPAPKVPKPPKTPPTDTGACGTYAGYRRHMRRNEKACAPCRAAAARKRREEWAAYERRTA